MINQTSKMIAHALAVSTVLILLALIVVNSPQTMWNAARSFLAVAAFDGLSTYPGAGSAQIYGQYYPPLGWWLLSPIGLSRNPTAIVMLGNTLSIVWIFVALVVAMRAGLQRKAPFNSTTALLLISVIWLLLPGTFYIVANVHIDAPALALGILSTAYLERSKVGHAAQYIAVAAALLCLSIWVKQVMIFILPAHLLLLWIRREPRLMLIYIAVFSAGIMSLSALMVYCYGLQPLMFHVLELPGQTPPRPLVATLSSVLPEILLTVCIVVALLLLTSSHSLRPSDSLSKAFVNWGSKDHSAAYLVVGLCLLPISIISSVRYGGDVNSFISLPFLLVSLVISIMGWLNHGSSRVGILLFYCSMSILLVSVVAKVGFSYPSNVLKIPVTVAWQRLVSAEAREDNPLHTAYDYLLAAPNDVYMPSYPLASWLAKGVASPYETSVCEREIIFKRSAEKSAVFQQLGFVPREVVYYNNHAQACKQRYYFIGEYYPDELGNGVELMPGWRKFTLKRLREELDNAD